ncbi:MAG: bacterial Ig-like domain-containing protein [Bacilli bacterium]|nr:bacterial Ig-like domain-containing protein [Bacilli bacterium]
MKKDYLFSTKNADRIDQLDTTGLAIKAVYSDGSEKDVALADATITAPKFDSAGAKTIKVAYGGKEKTFDVNVGIYAATAATIANVDGHAIITVSGTFDGVTDEAFEAFPWSADFQENGYNGGAWNGGWAEKANDPVVMDADNKTFTFTRDVTDLADYLYTGHFGHKKVVNDQGGMQNMDLRIDATEEKSESIVIGERSYKIDYNLGSSDPAKCWGSLSLTVGTVGAPAWNYESFGLEKDGETANVVVRVAFENMTEEEFRAKEWRCDFQNNDNYSGGGWGYVYKDTSLEMGSKWVIADGIATYKIDVTAFPASRGYTFHIGVGGNENQAPDYKPETFTAPEAVTVGTNVYNLVATPGSSDGKQFWGCIGLTIVDTAAPEASILASSVSGTEKAKLTLSGTGKKLADNLFGADLQRTSDWTTTELTPSVAIDGDSWTLNAELPELAAATYLVHWAFNGNKYDLEKKDNLQADFEASSTVIGTKTYELKTVEMWSRQMICVVVTDA